MCGIAGIWGNVTDQRLRAMADSLRHRGPDDETYWIHPGKDLGFAHRRLSIIDLEGGRQPVASEDNQVLTMLNGEIYNYKELRDELVARGHVLKTKSDTEVIVHLYEDHGLDFVEKLRGMFAIALWDDRARQLVLVRDRVGKKPLYFSETGDEFIFASEIKGLTVAWDGPLNIDPQSLVDYLGWGMVLAPATIYRELRSLEPGQLIVVRDRRIVRRTFYWRHRMLPKMRLSRKEAVDAIDEHLREAVRLRLRSDVPVGAFLSGGIDSGIVTAMAAQQYPSKLTTITIGFEDGSFDERPLARLVAKRYATDHHEILVKPDVARDLPRIVQAYDQPFGSASAIPSYYVAKAARESVKVVLNGDGGDELLAGYRRYVAARMGKLLPGSDLSVPRAFWAIVSKCLPPPKGFRSPYAFVHRLARGLSLDPSARYMAWVVDAFNERSLGALLGGEGLARACRSCCLGVPIDRFASVALDTFHSSGPVDRMLAADFTTILPHDLLVKMDIATMANGLEARSPLLDHALVETVSRFPEHLKLSGFETKPLLRLLSRRYVPEAVRRAPKRGFEVPLVAWLRGELRELCEDIVLSRDGLLADLFHRTALARLVRTQDGLDPARWSRCVWHLLMLGMWDRYVNKART